MDGEAKAAAAVGVQPPASHGTKQRGKAVRRVQSMKMQCSVSVWRRCTADEFGTRASSRSTANEAGRVDGEADGAERSIDFLLALHCG
jgi:hypothetical protein